MNLIKTLTVNSKEIKIYGDDQDIEIQYDEAEQEGYFIFQDQKYYLGDFVERDLPDWMEDFDGYNSDSFFSGLLIKYDDYDDLVKVYTYIG